MHIVYRDYRDIDLYTGILAEIPLEDAIVGPVGSCILADQFVRLKKADRYWYETADPSIRFTPGNAKVHLLRRCLIEKEITAINVLRYYNRAIGGYTQSDICSRFVR